MTPERLAELEPLARAACADAGRDPDYIVPHGADADASGYVPMVLLHSPLWTRIARQIDPIERVVRLMGAQR